MAVATGIDNTIRRRALSNGTASYGRYHWRRVLLLLLPLLLCCLCGCHRKEKEPTFVVGVSIDFYDVWHDKMCSEIVQEAVLHPELQLVVKNAYGSRERQQLQLDSLLNSGVDLLIVGVEDPMYVRVALQHAMDNGIPVVINSRNPKIDDYTAFVGTDNVRVGFLMADYLKVLADKGSTVPNTPCML